MTYVEPGHDSAVDWFVLVKRRTQVSVGCRYTESGLDEVADACEEVVRTLVIAGE
jgi:hypothetical protein